MTQPHHPGPSYYPQQPSAPSAPAPGQAYPPQPSAPSAPAPGQAYQAQFQGAPGAGGAPAPGQLHPPQAADSFFGNLFDTSRGYVEKFGKAVFIIAVVGIAVTWLNSAYSAGSHQYDPATQSYGFSIVSFLVNLLVHAPWNATLILLVRLFIELVRGSARPGARP